MYILIFEDGDMRKAEKVSDDDFMASEDGYVDIIDISNSEEPKVYVFNEWKVIPTIKEIK